MIMLKTPTAAPNDPWCMSVRDSRSRASASRSSAVSPAGGDLSATSSPAAATADFTPARSVGAGTHSTSASTLPRLTWALSTPGVPRTTASMRVTQDAHVTPRMRKRILALPVR